MRVVEVAIAGGTTKNISFHENLQSGFDGTKGKSEVLIYDVIALEFVSFTKE